MTATNNAPAIRVRHRISQPLPTDVSLSYFEYDPGDDAAVTAATPGTAGTAPIVLIHGATDSHLSFSQIAPLIANAGFHVIVPELRGHGLSDRPLDKPYTVAQHTADVLALLDQLGVERAHVVGHSLGSFIAQRIGATTDLAVTISLLGSAATLRDNAGFAWLLDGGDGFPGLNHTDVLGDAFVRDWTATDNPDEGFRQATYEHARALPIELWRHIFADMEPDFADQSAIHAPVLLFHGAGDEFFGDRDQLDLIGRLGSETILYLTIPDIGHNGHWDKGQAPVFADDIVQFARTAPRYRVRP